MTPPTGSSLTPPAWGAPAIRSAPQTLAPTLTRPAPVHVPARSGEVLGALLLVVGWILIWAYFVIAIAEQAAALRSTVDGAAGGERRPAEARTAAGLPATPRARP